MRELVERLMAAGQWQDGEPDVLSVVDAGYDVPRLALLQKDLQVQVLGRTCSARFLRRTVPPRMPGARGRPPRGRLCIHRGYGDDGSRRAGPLTARRPGGGGPDGWTHVDSHLN